MILTILSTIILLGILVFIHELGHFILARLNNVKVEKFSFGFGPKLIGKQIGETEYRISLIPLGGYVKMLGENPDEEKEKNIESERSFKNKKWWQKALIALGGPFSNFIFALIILSISFIIGIKVYDLLPVIGKISESNKEIQQFQKGDQILKIDGKDIKGWVSIAENWVKDDRKKHEVLILRKGEEKKLLVGDFDYKYWFTEIKPEAEAVIGDVLYGLPAYKAGIRENDKVLKIENQEVKDWYDFQEIVNSNPNKKLKFLIKRNNELLDLYVTPQIYPESDEKKGIIGISLKNSVVFNERYNLFHSLKFGFINTISMIQRYYYGLFKLLQHPSEATKSFGGPIMIAAITGQQVKEGISTFLTFMAMISIVLMIMNLLPIPILDGGQIIFALIEGIFRKPLTVKTQMMLQRIGIIIILTLTFFAFYNDISKFVSRQFSLKRTANSVRIQ